MVNEVTMKWRQCWDDQSGQKLLDCKNANLTSIAAFGRIAKEINPCDVYCTRASVAAERDWWLRHLSSIFRYMRFTGFLDALILQPGDWITVTWIDGGGRNLFGGVSRCKSPAPPTPAATALSRSRRGGWSLRLNRALCRCAGYSISFADLQ